MNTEPNIATMELRDSGWVVIYGGTVVGRHHAKFRAREQMDALNAPELEGEQS